MSVYTPPALNAVDFALTAYTPANITPYEVALSSYTPPALNAVNFALTTYTAPTFPDVGWELLPSVDQTATIATGQGGQTSDIVGTIALSAAIETGQGSQTTDITATVAYMAEIETGQGSQSTDGVLFGDTPPTPVIVVDGDDGGIAWRGRFGTRLPRPKELAPDVAEKRVVKKVAKRLGISKAKAQIAVTQAQRELASLLKFNRVQSIAYSNYSEEYTPADMAMIKTWWATLEREAIERAEEEELLLLI